jgi:hypothetical protein
MPACDIYNSHAGLQTLCHNPRLQIIRPASVSPPRLDHLATPNKPIWTYNNDRPNMGIDGIPPAMKLKMAA